MCVCVFLLQQPSFTLAQSTREHCVFLLVSVRTHVVDISQGVKLDQKCNKILTCYTRRIGVRVVGYVTL